jgi:hypothetical protein
MVVNNNGNNMNVSINEQGEEELNHITKDMMMTILNDNNFEGSMGNLVQNVFFHPLATRNMTWCVTDTTIQNGALEYSKESNTLVKKRTDYVIVKNIQNVIFKVCDILEELKIGRTFNKKQIANSNRMYNLVGNDLPQECINSIKKVAYENRGLPKAVWKFSNVMIEKIPVSTQCKLK